MNARGFVGRLCMVALLSPATPAQENSSRSEDLRVRIAFMETVLHEETNQATRVKWEGRLETLRRELTNLERRAELEQREASLARRQNQNTARALLETLGSIDSDTRGPHEQAIRLSADFSRLRADRADLETRRRELQKDRDKNLDAILDFNERLRNKDEAIVLCNLQRDLAELQLRRAQEAIRIDNAIRQMPINPRPSVRAILEQRRQIKAEAKNTEDTALLINDADALSGELAAALALSEAKFAQLDDEIRQLEERRKFRLGLEIRQLLGVARSETKLLEDRIDLQRQQVGTLDQTLETAKQLADLYRRERAVLERQLADLLRRWWTRVLVPVTLILALIALNILGNAVFLPRFYKQDRLFIARRLSRYTTVALAFVVTAAFFMEDLKAIATALGIAGAALVIALQDLFSSLAGWFVIVTSGKVRVGDRLEIDTHKGDVIDIQLLRTTLLELDNWLGVDEPTGRIIVIPNSYIFKSKVFNYSHVHPYLWSRVDITVTFETPAGVARETLQRVMEEETADEFDRAKAAATRMVQKYGTADTDYRPKLSTRIADSGVLFSLLYVSHYRRRVAVRNRLNDRIIAEFEKDPRLEFAYPTERRIPTPRGDRPSSGETPLR
jgi:small-conductance mechanosensitive channel